MVNFEISISEPRTPTDRRTTDRKILENRCKEMKQPFYKSEYGIWLYLRMKDIKIFKGNINHN